MRIETCAWALVWVVAACGGSGPGSQGSAEGDPMSSGSPTASESGSAATNVSATDSDGAGETAGSSAGTDGADGQTGADASDQTTDSGSTGSDTGGMSVDPDLPGPAGSSTSQVDIDSNGVSIPLTVFVPEGDGPFPVVVFSHGFQLTPGNYTSYGEHLASWEIVVVMPQLPGSLFDPASHSALSQHLVSILDWVEGGGIEGGVADPGRVALAGHSMGGKVSLLTAANDARPTLVVGVDPVDAAGGPGGQPSPDNPSVTPELMADIDARLVIIGETVNATGGLGGACAPEADNFHQYFVHATAPALEIEFTTANHMSFLDDPNCGFACTACPAGSDDPGTTLLMTRGYLVAAVLAYLGPDPSYEPWLTGAPMQADVATGLVTATPANEF